MNPDVEWHADFTSGLRFRLGEQCMNSGMFLRCTWCRLMASAVLTLSSACGSDPRPTTAWPTSPTPTPWVITGTVIANPSGAAVEAARMSIDDSPDSILTGLNGTFRVEGAGSQDRRITVAHDGFLTRETNVRGGVSKTGVVIDLIAEAAPFELAFFREFARGEGQALPNPGERNLALRVWNEVPSFYVKTTDQAGNDVPPSVVERVIATIAAGVPVWSGGRFGTPIFELGEGEPTNRSGWVHIYFHVNDPNKRGSSAGVGPGSPQLAAYIRFDLTDTFCGTLAFEGLHVSSILHELGHVMGYFHPSPPGLMAGDRCIGGLEQITERERFHAKLAYSRVNGNRDPDRDPPSFFITSVTSSDASNQMIAIDR